MGSDRSKPDPPGKHEGCAEDGNGYNDSTPNCHKLDNQNNLQDHGTNPHLLLSAPSEKPLLPHASPYPSKSSKKSSLLPAWPLLPPKKDNIVDTVSLMNTDCPDTSWKHLLAPAKKCSGIELAEELEMREGTD